MWKADNNSYLSTYVTGKQREEGNEILMVMAETISLHLVWDSTGNI